MATVAARPMLVKARGPPFASKGRARKANLPLDTNPSSYDRTDPFAALNVLRTLLASLPARIGGCAHKLTPEEHRLALHLLTIVEPFVGLAPQKRTLTRQPTEILDAIVFHLDAKRDLLSLALACRRLHGIIFPRHYEYRVVRCKVSRIAVWNHLAVHRGLARNVRRLEIMDERGTEPESVPSDILATDTDLESTDDELRMHGKQERILSSALTRMTALESFVWSCSHSPISIDHIWPTLLKCQTLKDVQINDNLVFSPSELAATEAQASENKGKSKKRQYVLPALKTMSLQSTKYTYGASKNPEMTRISGMLTNCPVLESLSIAYQPRRAAGFHLPAADDFLLCARWSTLRTLVLTNLRCSPIAGPDAVASFLAAHAELEVLHLDISFGGRTAICLPDETLPKLKELKAGREIANAVLACPVSPLGRPLETLKGLKLSGSGGDAFLANLRAFGQAVKRVELLSYTDIDDVRKLAEAAPQLTWLDVGRRADAHGVAGAAAMGVDRAGRPAPAIATNFAEWAGALAHLPQLATFHGVRFFYEVAPSALVPPSAAFAPHNSSSGPHGGATIPLAPSERTRLPLTPSDRSRMRKNEEVAATLAGKCQKLRRLDHWEEGTGRVVILAREGDKVRYEVRRVRG